MLLYQHRPRKVLPIIMEKEEIMYEEEIIQDDLKDIY